ncbi:kinase-like domain-containing protein [Rhizophagus clarus]|nr:kinase-like domain-containing protein [Rhizophagus clarus]
MVSLKYLNNSQIITNEFLNNEVKQYSMSFKGNNNILKIYGISQHPDTKEYIMVLQDGYCEECGENYTEIENKWCRSCRINDLKENFTTNGNEKIDEFVQKMLLKINSINDIVFEWIPYEQFNDIEETGRNLNSALWKNGPLMYSLNEKKWIRVQYRKVTLKICDPQNMIYDFLNKVNVYNNIFKIHGITRNPDSKDYVMVLQKYHQGYAKSYCETCIEEYTDIEHRWCKPCQKYYLRKHFTNLSGNEKIDEFIQEMQLKINNPNDMVFEWIPYNQFNDIKEIGKGGFSTVYSAEWKNGLLYYDKEWKRGSSKKVALKCLYESQNVTDEFLNEIKAYSMNKYGGNIIKIYGISQDPKTKNHILVLQHAEGRNFNYWMSKCYKDFDWNNKLRTLYNIIIGLNEIHKKEMVHRDFHTGNILFEHKYVSKYNDTYISDMGLCGKIGNTDRSKIYGVMPYVAPEVLRGKPYTKAADIYSFGMVMYFAATGRQPFADRAHNVNLALVICGGTRPKLNEQKAPKCYIELMKRCWDSDPDNRPDAIEIENIIYSYSFNLNGEIKKQFEEAEKYRKANPSSIKIRIQSMMHPQAYTSRLLNYSECLDCTI